MNHEHASSSESASDEQLNEIFDGIQATLLQSPTMPEHQETTYLGHHDNLPIFNEQPYYELPPISGSRVRAEAGTAAESLMIADADSVAIGYAEPCYEQTVAGYMELTVGRGTVTLISAETQSYTEYVVEQSTQPDGTVAVSASKSVSSERVLSDELSDEELRAEGDRALDALSRLSDDAQLEAYAVQEPVSAYDAQALVEILRAAQDRPDMFGDNDPQ